jgi:outer membrane protein TolC
MNLRLLLTVSLLAFPLEAVEQLTLVEVARRAVARNPGLQAADAQVDMARRERSEPGPPGTLGWKQGRLLPGGMARSTPSVLSWINEISPRPILTLER